MRGLNLTQMRSNDGAHENEFRPVIQHSTRFRSFTLFLQDNAVKESVPIST